MWSVPSYPPPNPMFTGSTSGVKKKESGGGGSGGGGGGGGQNKEMNMFVWSSSASPVSEANARNAMTRGASADLSTDPKASIPPHDNLATKGSLNFHLFHFLIITYHTSIFFKYGKNV